MLVIGSSFDMIASVFLHLIDEICLFLITSGTTDAGRCYFYTHGIVKGFARLCKKSLVN